MSTETKDGRTLVIRPAVKADAAALGYGFKRVGAEGVHIGSEGGNANGVAAQEASIVEAERNGNLMLTAEVGGEFAGTLGAQLGAYGKKDAHRCTFGMYCLAEYRGLGVGTELVEGLLAWARAEGLEKVCLEVFSSNEAAIALYRKMGFEEEGRLRRHYVLPDIGYVDAVQMALFLDES